MPVRFLDYSNPYQPPNSTDDAAPLRLLNERSSPHRVLAILIFAVTILGALAFIYYTETANQSNPPPGIVLIVATGIVSIVTAIITRDILFAPLCCFGGMMSGVILAAMMKDWEYVSLEVTLPMSIVVSIPAFVIARVLGRRKTPSLRLTDN